MAALVLRLLYRLRSLSEKGPLDGPSFTFISSFLNCVVCEHSLIGHGEDEDEPVERMVLVIEIVNLHAVECKRGPMIESDIVDLFLLSFQEGFPSIECARHALQCHTAVPIPGKRCILCARRTVRSHGSKCRPERDICPR